MFDCEKLIDILWYQRKEDIDFDKIKNNKFLNELYSAKNYINSVSTSSDFDLNILILINKYQKDIKTNLTFEFICNSCRYDHKKKSDWVIEGPSHISRQSVISAGHYEHLNELKVEAMKHQKALGFMDIDKRP